MLGAARQRFLRESYENVGLRDIAGDAGVDVALVGRYFGCKEDLFREVLRGGEADDFRIDGAARELPARLASLLTSNDDALSRDQVESLLIMLRSASSPVAAKIVQEAMREGVLGPIAAMLDGDKAESRAGLSLAILMGATMLRAIMGVEPSCAADREFIGRRLPDIFEAALSDA
jgi:AcrR family transcriptional regulator